MPLSQVRRLGRDGYVFGHGAVGLFSWTSSRVVFLLSGILTFVAPPQGVPSSINDYLLEIVVVAAFVLTLVTLAGLHAAKDTAGATGYWGRQASG